MGDREFWWRAIVQRANQTDAEDEAEDTNEKAGSHEGHKDEQLTKPTAHGTKDVSDLDLMESDSVANQTRSEDLPGSSLTPQQTKSQRKKDRRRERRANATIEKPFATTDEPSDPNKPTSTKQVTDGMVNMTTDDSGNATALAQNQKDKQTNVVDEVILMNLPQSNKTSGYLAILHGAKGKPKEKTDAVSTVGNSTQSRQVSDSTLDKGKAKALARDQKDTNTDKIIAAARKASVHNDQFLDVTIDKGKRTAPTRNLIDTKTGEQVDIGSHVTAQNKKPSSVTPDRQKGKIPNTSKPDKGTNRGTQVASPIISQSSQCLNITLHKGTDRILISEPSDEKIDRSTSRASNAISQAAEPCEITLGEETTATKILADKKCNQSITFLRRSTAQPTKPLVSTDDKEKSKASIKALSDEKIDRKIDVASDVVAQGGKPSITTLDKGKGRTLMNDLPAKNIHEKSDTASQTQKEAKQISGEPSQTQEENRSVASLTLHSDLRANFARLVAIPNIQHMVKYPSKGKEMAAIKDVFDKKIDERIDTASKSGNETAHVAVPSSNHSKEKVIIADRTDQNDPTINVAGTITAQSKQPVDISLDERTDKEFAENPSSESVSQSNGATSKSLNQMVHIPVISSSIPKEEASIRDVTDKTDPSLNVASMMTAQNEQPSDIIIGKKSEKILAGGPGNKKKMHTSNVASSKPKNKTVHFHPNLTVEHEEEAYLGDKMVTKPINGASKQATHRGHGSEVSTNINQDKAQATDFAPGKGSQPLSNSSSLSIQNQPKPFPARGVAGVRGPRGLKWAYFTHTKADESLLANGIWLFEKPKTYFKYQPYHYVRRGLGLDLAPIAVATYEEEDVHEPHEPNIDVDNTAVWINTHIVPWRDVRSKPTHPDFLPIPKLTEYQACESLGLAVWRHDRALLKCRLAACKVKTADHNPLTVICLGCGPKTIIRYCSVAHQIADLEGHWEECGDPDYLMRRVIDHTTTPARFGRLWPAIRDRSGNSSYQRSRQATYAAMHHGRYTLFDPVTQEPTALIWPTNDGQAAVMESRVERLLNYALFDHKHGRIIGLLYRMIRQCLIQKNFWAIGPQFALKIQFKAEFGCDVSKVSEQPLCECEWMGGRLPRGRHVAGCKQLYLAYSAQYQATGIKGFLEMVEGRYWALRAWQQRHPTVGDWSARVAGVGFGAEVVEGTEPFLGPGWSGWGAPADDLVD